MCIGIPMQVLQSAPGRALCRDGERRCWIDTRLVDSPAPGSWLLVSVGAAREILGGERAALLRDALQAMRAAGRGDLAALRNCFADLDREPQLPPHLQARASCEEKL
jgi:hydrogenase expression/formation protein HypC